MKPIKKEQIKYQNNPLVSQRYGKNPPNKNLNNLNNEKNNNNYNILSLDPKIIPNKKLKPLTPIKNINRETNEINKKLNNNILLNSNNNSFYKKTLNFENNEHLDIINIKNNISHIMKELKDANINQTKSDISDIKTKVEGIKDIDIKDIKDELFTMKKDIEEIKKLLFAMLNNNQFNNHYKETSLSNENKQNNIKSEANIQENKYFKSTKKEKIITITFDNKNHFIK